MSPSINEVYARIGTRTLLHMLFLLGGLALLCGMVWQVGGEGLVASLHATGPWLVPFLLLEAVPVLLHTAGWGACFPDCRLSLRLWQLALVRHAGTAVNSVTPTAEIGGDVLRVVLLAPLVPHGQAIATVMIDRASVTLAKMLYLLLGMLYVTQHLSLPAEVQLSVNVTLGLILLGLLGFVALQRYGLLSKLMPWLRYLPLGHERLRRLRLQVAALDTHLVAYYTRHPWRFLGSLLLHGTAFMAQVLKTYILLRLLLGDNTPAFGRALMVPVAVAALDQVFFFVPGRLGTLEGARFMVLSALGVAQVYGVAFGLIARVEQLVWGGIGFLAYVLFVRLFPRSARQATVSQCFSNEY